MADDPAPAPEETKHDQTEDNEPLIFMPSVISEEFGMAPHDARMMLQYGIVEVDEKPWEGDRLRYPLNQIDGKTITVESEMRSVKFSYRAE